MTFQEYLDNLVEVAREHPEYLKLQVVYAADDIGTFFSPLVNVTPEIGVFDKENETFDFYNEPDKIGEPIVEDIKECNAICIN